MKRLKIDRNARAEFDSVIEATLKHLGLFAPCYSCGRVTKSKGPYFKTICDECKAEKELLLTECRDSTSN